MFKPKSLEQAASRAGLQVVAINNALTAATNWAASLLKYFALKRSSAIDPTTHVLYPLLVLMFIPLTVVQGWVAGTGSVDFVFRKAG